MGAPQRRGQPVLMILSVCETAFMSRRSVHVTTLMCLKVGVRLMACTKDVHVYEQRLQMCTSWVRLSQNGWYA